MAFLSPSNYNTNLSFKNKIINGNFDVWQRNTSQTSTGYGSDDRWKNNNSGSTKTHSRQSFTIGQTDVPNNPRYYSRTVVTSSAGASNYVMKNQKIENVKTLSGKTATVTFYAKADASKNIAIEFIQVFGTGGSPSADVTAIGVTTCALTTSWQKFTISAAIPSISGKTLGSNNDDYLQLDFWFDAGSSYNSRTNSLGQQSGTFDIAQVQVEEGSTSTPFEIRPLGIELQLCQRYYQKSYDITTVPGTITTNGAMIFRSCGSYTMQATFVIFPVTMRDNPVVTLYSSNNGASGYVYRSTADNISVSSVQYIGDTGYGAFNVSSAVADGVWISWHHIADAEL